MNLIKRMAIKIFRLKDIESVILSARQNEISKAHKDKTSSLDSLRLQLERKHSLEIQSKNTEISILLKKINEFEREKSKVRDLEYECNMQIKQNVAIASEIGIEIKSFAMNIIAIDGKIDGIINRAKIHNDRITK